MEGNEADIMDLMSGGESPVESTPGPSESAATSSAEGAPPSEEGSLAAPITTQKAPQEPEAPSFDYNLPLNPREQQLLERLERITGERLELSSLQQAATPQVAAPPPEAINFLDGTDLDEVFSSAENVNKLLVAVYNKALENAAALAAEKSLQNIPGTVTTYVAQYLASTKMVDTFYEENPDLVGVKQTVAAVANEISANHPDYTLQQVLDEAGKGTREALKLRSNPPAKKAAPIARPVALPGQKGGAGQRFSVPELEGLEKEINDLLIASR